MTTFEDGPAKGQKFMMRRAPIFLRVVLGEKWDHLDQPEDTPTENEKVYAYVLTARPGVCHIRAAKSSSSGFFPMGNYRLVEPQPSEAQMRSLKQWRDWCEAQRPPEWWLKEVR